MARDIYIKWGETKELDDFGKPKPEIEGDSSDETHFWWTEVRECDFSIAAATRPKDSEDDKEESSDPPERDKGPFPKLGEASISKKVDWGSVDLFRLCCQAPAELKKNENVDPKEDEGQLKNVIIEVCRKSGVASEGRYSFLTITFGGVYVMSYSITFSGPDPTENITFKYGRVSYQYISSNPLTGGRMDPYDAKGMYGYPVQPDAAAQAAAGGTGAALGATGGGGGAGGGLIVAPIAAVAAGASGGGSSAPAAGPTPDAAIAANFPGYMSVAGNGILAD